MNEKLTDARQLLAACGWFLMEDHTNSSKVIYVVYDKCHTPRRSFVPIERLYDYARGVFDAQEFNNV